MFSYGETRHKNQSFFLILCTLLPKGLSEEHGWVRGDLEWGEKKSSRGREVAKRKRNEGRWGECWGKEMGEEKERVEERNKMGIRM